ncbi:hypothetical protein VTL71DRAFT_11278, partial [Oculimacula yallundae]
AIRLIPSRFRPLIASSRIKIAGSTPP